MKVREVMTEQVECVLRDGTLQDAALKMKALGVGALPVVHKGEAVGVVTDRDLVLRGVAEGKDPATTKVRDVMADAPLWCEADDPLASAARVMTEHGVRRVLVRNGNEKLAGIVSLGDMAGHEKARPMANRVLADVCADG